MTRGADLDCLGVEARIADLLAGSLGDDEVHGVEAHCAGCARCRQEIASLRRTWEGLEALSDEEPAPTVRARFEATLTAYLDAVEAAQAGPRQAGPRQAGPRQAGPRQAGPRQAGPRQAGPREAATSWWQGWWPTSPAWQLGIAVAALLAGIVIGGARTSDRDAELHRLRSEVAGLSRLVGLSLLERGSASERLRGVNFSRRIADSDPEVWDLLLHTVRADPDVNVRLAAIDVLADLVDRTPVREGLRQALPRQQAPLVQLALVDLLLSADGTASQAAVRQLLADQSLDSTVRRYVVSRLGREI